jgi:hypothetical protein
MEASSIPFALLVTWLRCRLDGGATGQHAQDCNQDYCADKGSYNAYDIDTVEHIRAKDNRGEEAANQTTDDADDKVTDYTIAAAFHYQTGEPTCDQTYD